MRLSRRRLALAAIFLLSAMPVVAAPVAARDTARAEHDRIVAHWTPARLKAAVPRDFVKVGNAFKPTAKPPKPPGGGGTVTGASWTGGGEILRASGKVFFEMDSGAYVCSGAVANDGRSGYSLILTAAHCAYDEADGGFATNWMFIPEFDSAPTFTCSQTRYGCWTASALVVHSGFADAGGFNTEATKHDFAFAVVPSGGKTNAQLDATVGSFPISYTSMSSGTTVYAFGYPAAGKYKGKDLTYCAGPISNDPLNENATWGLACRMTGGSSGGPWLAPFTTGTGDGTLHGLNSYGYSGISNMYGPKFNSDTQAVFNAANGATSSDIIVP